MNKNNLKRIQLKLQKLLALSASENEAEASLAMEKCRELMTKYGIRTIDVDEETNEVGISTACVDGYTKKHRTWESKLAAAIAGCFDAEALIQRNPHKWNIMFISGESERDIIVDLYKRLRRTISKMSKEYCTYNIGNNRSLQKSYAFGMIKTIRTRLHTIYLDIPETRALVVIKKQAVDARIKELFPGITKMNFAKPTNRDAFIKGEIDGKAIQLHKTIADKKQYRVSQHI